MKKLIYFFMGCILLGLLLSFIFLMLPVFNYSANGFLLGVKHGDYEQTYDLMSDRFKKRYSFKDYKELVGNSELRHYEKAVWEKSFRNKDNTYGYLLGTVTTEYGKELPIKIEFVGYKGEDWFDKGWRIDNIIINPQETGRAPGQQPVVAPPQQQASPSR